MPEKIDVTTTATLRPSVVEMTFWSFWRLMLKDHDCRVIINVDPVGDEQYTQQDVVDVVQRYFPNVKANFPKEACFLRALKWVLSQVETEFFFYLEDDYKLDCPIVLDEMLRAFRHDKRLALLRFPQGNTFTNEDGKRECRWKKYGRGAPAFWNGYYYEGPGIGFTGMPALVRTEWVREFLPYLGEQINHEVQFRILRHERLPVAVSWKFGVFAEDNTPITAHEIGTAWKKSRRIGKNAKESIGVGDGFTTWVRGGQMYTGRRDDKVQESNETAAGGA